MKYKPLVRSQTVIEVKPPDGFSISGDTKVKPQEVHEEDEVDKIISDLVDYIYIQEEQTKKLRGILSRLKKLYPCKNCD
jgi:hypothetical protein